MTTCQWYAGCQHEAVGTARGPIGNGVFGPIPVCGRCAYKHDLPVSPFIQEEN